MVCRISARIGILGRRITFLRDRFPEQIDDKKAWFGTARSRMQESQLLRGLKRRRGEEAVQNVKPLYHISTLEMVLNSEVTTRDGRGRKMDSAKLLRWRAFFFILIATGCRPKHVLGIRALILTSRKLPGKMGSSEDLGDTTDRLFGIPSRMELQTSRGCGRFPADCWGANHQHRDQCSDCMQCVANIIRDWTDSEGEDERKEWSILVLPESEPIHDSRTTSAQWKIIQGTVQHPSGPQHRVKYDVFSTTFRSGCRGRGPD